MRFPVLSIISQPDSIVHEQKGLIVPSVMVTALVSDQSNNPVGSHVDVVAILGEGYVDFGSKVEGPVMFGPPFRELLESGVG